MKFLVWLQIVLASKPIEMNAAGYECVSFQGKTQCQKVEQQLSPEDEKEVVDLLNMNVVADVKQETGEDQEEGREGAENKETEAQQDQGEQKGQLFGFNVPWIM